jgi:hypothetical protein
LVVWQKAEGKRLQRAEGFYVYYYYVVVSAIKSVPTFMGRAIERYDSLPYGGVSGF